MFPFFKYLIQQGSAVVYIDDFLLRSNAKPHMRHFIKQLHETASKINLNLVPKIFSMLFTVKSFGHEIRF